MDRNLHIVGLAKKAGLLAIGAKDAAASAKAGKARLVISARDASDGSLRKASRTAQTTEVAHIVAPYTACELGRASGRGSPATLAISDLGLALKFLGGLAEAYPDDYRDEAMRLSEKALKSERQPKAAPPSGSKKQTRIKRRTVQ